MTPPRPRPPAPICDNIPTELKCIRHWVPWSYELCQRRSGEWVWTKVPKQPDGSNASSTDPATWCPFEYVEIAYSRGDFDGIGFVLDGSEGLVGFDWDHVVQPGGSIIDAKARDGRLLPTSRHVAALDSYTEISPSGTGLRSFVGGRLPEEFRKEGSFECYRAGRFLTVTGHHLPGTPLTINQRQLAIAAVHAHVFAERIARRQAVQARAHVSNLRRAVNASDEELLGRARRARNADRFIQLFDQGDWQGAGYPSHSEADIALCRMLAFWCGPDEARIDRLFRSSRLNRLKWEERGDYRGRTLATVAAGCVETWSGGGVVEDDDGNLI